MDDRKEYYEFLEELRKSGVTNMWGAAPFLQAEFDISADEARDILLDWIKNYDKLSSEYGWRSGEVKEVETVSDDRVASLFDEDVEPEEAEEVLEIFDDEPEFLEDAEHIWIVEEAPVVVKYNDGKVKFFDSTDGHLEKYDDLIDWCNTYGYEYEDVSERVFEKTNLDKPEEETIEDDEKEFIDGDSEKVIDDVEDEEKPADESLNESPSYEYRDESMVSLGQVGVMHDVTGEYVIFKDNKTHESNKDSLRGLTRTDVKYIIEACKELLNKESK